MMAEVRKPKDLKTALLDAGFNVSGWTFRAILSIEEGLELCRKLGCEIYGRGESVSYNPHDRVIFFYEGDGDIAMVEYSDDNSDIATWSDLGLVRIVGMAIVERVNEQF